MDLSSIDAIIKRYGTDLSACIPILQAVQAQYRYIPKTAIDYMAKQTGIPSSHIYGVATFYAQFRLQPVGKHIIKVCHGTACHVAGASRLNDALSSELSISAAGGTNSEKSITVESVACLGCCSLAPVLMVDDRIHANVVPGDIPKLIVNTNCNTSAFDNVGMWQCLKKEKQNVRKPIQDSITHIDVGMGSCGIASGAEDVWQLLADAKKYLHLNYDLARVGCMGNCHAEPIIRCIYASGEEIIYGNMQPDHVIEFIEKQILYGNKMRGKQIDIDSISGPAQFYKMQYRIALENCGHIDPEDIQSYEMADGYKSLQRVLSKLSSETIIDEIEKSGLRGRGGGGFSTGKKWRFASQNNADQKYIICNADEGDPGAFMDRSILESDPHRVIEGMIIAGYAIQASKGYIYCRAEYPLAIKRLENAISQAIQNHYLGKHILGSDFSFHITIKSGAGAFVCGEETALIQSIEGNRGMPRHRPPFPVEKGLWGQPTCINNVETLANIPWIIRHGAKAFSDIGSEDSKGTKVFALAGDIARGGLVEVPMGMSLQDILYKIGGGSSSGKAIKAIQLGGPSGGCLPIDMAHTEIGYESLRHTGAIMGSGGLVVMDASTCMVDIAKFFLTFTQSESCGKCTFCRIGTRRMLEVLERITSGQGRVGDIDLLEELGQHIKAASLCGLGQTAPNPVLSTIKHFRAEYEAHILEKRCPAHHCRDLISYHIIADKCIGCGLCARVCPVDSIDGQRHEIYSIVSSQCTQCGACQRACKVGAIDVI